MGRDTLDDSHRRLLEAIYVWHTHPEEPVVSNWNNCFGLQFTLWIGVNCHVGRARSCVVGSVAAPLDD